MNFIYVSNYPLVEKQQKMSFFKFLNSMEKFRVSNQKILLDDKSLILEFSKDSNISVAKAYIDSFFKEKEEVKVMFIEQLVKKEDELILKLKGFGLKKIKI